MSRLGMKPVALPAGVSGQTDGSTVTVKGPKGELSFTCAAGITATLDGSQIVVKRGDDETRSKALHGTARSLIANMVKGVHEGFAKDLEIQGVGYKAQGQGQKLVLNLGFSHPIDFAVPAGIKCEVADGVRIKVSGADKHLVGEIAAQIRNFHKAEPYKGKGVRYKDEHVRRKAGKTVA